MSVIVPRVAGREGEIGGVKRICGGNKIILYDTIMVDTCCHAFFETHRMCNAKNKC